ncbi:piggyBac transposable element-derived protein 5-like [Pecten maximus]|uniref:piggyBac transposable element-derived protein 5-like n=1 Tax=Pecten maximus TaxID=6579 RepID=UPI00145874B8|nr:piggyBac transposable element-derived protein 5-like [Pecten maximus]
MESSDESDFDGFDEQDIDEANARCMLKQQELEQVESYNKSDIDFSDNSDDEEEDTADFSDNEIESENGGDPYLENLNFEWTRTLTEVILPDFNEITRVKHGLQSDANQLQYFQRFLPQCFFESVAEETNRYAQQKGPDPKWTPTSASEVRAFISVNIMMGVRRLPRLANYWSTDKRFSDPYISSIFPKSRFIIMNRYIHLRDTSNVPGRNDPEYDPLFKVRNMIDFIVPKLQENYNPGQKLSIDEGMIGFKGRVHFRQYMPAKPTK